MRESCLFEDVDHARLLSKVRLHHMTMTPSTSCRLVQHVDHDSIPSMFTLSMSPSPSRRLARHRCLLLRC
ncbi:unnamed protein product [Amoebophrya sp. A25]|nr:unnamed protein product [Amoebophrya sp. A25]|eukprot:GSA25T00021312001.1